MISSIETRLWNLLTALLAVAAIALPILSEQDQFTRGESPPLSLQLDRGLTTSPFWDLQQLDGAANVELSVAGRAIKNLAVVRYSLENVGRAPIRPEDFHKPLQISVDTPWEILAVRSDIATGGATLEWHRLDRRSFEASPALINPTDRVETVVYVNAPSKGDIATLDYFSEEPPVKWRTRVANMKDFVEKKSNAKTATEKRAVGPVVVILDTPAALMVLAAQAVFLAFYLRLAPLSLKTAAGVGYVLACATLSIASAEVFVHLLRDTRFPYSMIIGGTPPLWINLPILGAQIFVMTSLLVVHRRSQKE